MSTTQPATITPATATQPAATPVRAFKAAVTNIAKAMLDHWGARSHEAVGRISCAMAAAAAAARDPADLLSCTPQSVAHCVAVAAMTGIMPGTGPAALAYLVPQRPRKGEPPQLQLVLSHRGLAALARRCGQTMVAIPIGQRDNIEITRDGQVSVRKLDLDQPPMTWDELRGVIVVVRDLRAGRVVHRGWVARALIERRRAMSRSAASDYSPWSAWPVEMAMKTAMHYAVSRGWCVIDDTAAALALAAEAEMDQQQQQQQQQSMQSPDEARNAISRAEQLAARLGAEPQEGS
jgi:recombinational DNA repair protein RecT